MIPASASENEPDDRLTGGGCVFLTLSILMGMGVDRGHSYSLVAGVVMLILLAIIFFVGGDRGEAA